MCQHFIAPLLRCRVSILKTAVSILTWQGEVLWSRMWFSQSKACPLHCECVDLCDFLKCGKLDCIICGSGGLRVRFPLATMVSIIELSSKVVWGFPGDSVFLQCKKPSESFFGEGNSTPLQYSCLVKPHGWKEEHSRLQSMSSQKVNITEQVLLNKEYTAPSSY